MLERQYNTRAPGNLPRTATTYLEDAHAVVRRILVMIHPQEARRHTTYVRLNGPLGANQKVEDLATCLPGAAI